MAKLKPILFNTEMVQKIMAGKKTETRRVVLPQPEGARFVLDCDEENRTFDLMCGNNGAGGIFRDWAEIVAAAAEQIAGAGLILWTCREGELLENALEACARWGLHFDAVNDSLPSWKKFYGNDTRKVGATEYWDDKAYRVQNGKLMKEVAHEMD